MSSIDISYEDFAKLDIWMGKIVAADDGKPVLLHPEKEVRAGSRMK